MIDLYTHGTPNGIKIAIALEEIGLDYDAHIVDIFAGATRTPEFKKISPAGQIPVIVDHEVDMTVYESNAILLYLAEKTGKLRPQSASDRSTMMQLLFVQASFQGPMFGQRTHYSLFGPEVVPYAIRRYEEQCALVDAFVEDALQDRDFFLGDELSIVDISFFGWYHTAQRSGFLTQGDTNLWRWFERMMARPAVQRGIDATPEIELPPRRTVEDAA